MRNLLIFCILACLGAPTAAVAGGVTITVRDPSGKPLPEAAVTVASAAMPAATLARFAGPLEVVQQNIAFNPFVLVVPKGASVSFPNRDTVRHHVYSFSKVKKFELKLYGHQEDRQVVFDKVGTVPLGCNIHDRMRGFIRVVDTPFAGKTDASGRITIDRIPGGAAILTVWHPDAIATNGEFTASIDIPPTGTVAKLVTMRTTASR